MHMVILRVPFQQIDPLLIAQVPQNLANRPSQIPEDYLPPIFWNEDNVILALPSHMRQTLKVFHTLFLLPLRAFPGGRAYPNKRHAGTA